VWGSRQARVALPGAGLASVVSCQTRVLLALARASCCRAGGAAGHDRAERL
jgi:hypothetical protein